MMHFQDTVLLWVLVVFLGSGESEVKLAREEMEDDLEAWE